MQLNNVKKNENRFLWRLIYLTIRAIYKYKIDIGGIRVLFVFLNFVYVGSLLFPIVKLKKVVTVNQQSIVSDLDYLNSSIINQVSWYEGYKYLFIIFRPTLILHFNEDNSLNFILSVIIMVFLVFLVLGTVINVLNTRINQEYQFLFMKYVLFVANTNNYYVLMLTTEIQITIGIHGGFGNGVDSSFQNNTSSQMASRVICLVTLPLTYILAQYSILYGEQCLSHQEYGLYRNNTNTLVANIIMNIKFVQAIIIGIDPNYQSSFTFLIFILSCVVFIILKYYEYFFDVPFSTFTVQDWYFSMINQACVIIVLCLFKDNSYFQANFEYTPNILNPQMFALILFLSSLIYHNLANKLWEIQKRKFLFDNICEESMFKKSEHRKICRKINMLIANQDCSMKDQAIYYMGVFNRHQKYCRDQFCFCHRSQFTKGVQDNQLLLSNRVYEQLIRMYIRNDLRLIDIFNQKEDSFQFLRYMDHFLSVKKHTFALCSIIDVQIEQEKMKKQMNLRTQASLEVMLQIIKETMSIDIKKGIVDLTVEQTSRAIEIYIQMENQKTKLKSLIFKCLEIKREAMEQMKKSFEYSWQVENLNKSFVNIIDQTESLLIDFYNKYTTPQSQQILVFFESEIKGNLKKANQVKQAHKQSDIAQYLNSKNMFIEVFSQDVISITATVGKKLGRIVGYSDKAPSVFGYKKQEFHYVSDIKELMPITLASVHDEVVRFMMIRGKYNVVHIARTVFLKNKFNFIFQVNIFADINFFYTEELPFIFLAKVIKSNSGFLIVSSRGKVEGICQNFFSKIGQPVESLPYAYKVDVQYILPKFEEFIKNAKPFIKSDYSDVDLSFPETKSALFYDLFYRNKSSKQNLSSTVQQKDQDLGGLDSMRSQTSSVRKKLLQKEIDILKFKTDISIQQRVLGTTKGDLVYYVVEIKQLQLNNYKNLNNSLYSSNQSVQRPLMQSQKSNFSRIDKETANQVVSLNSTEQFEDEGLNPPKTNFTRDETILESEHESKQSSNSQTNNLKSAKSIIKSKTKNKNGKNKKDNKKLNESLDANKVLDESSAQLISKVHAKDLNQSFGMIDTTRTMASDIMIEHRFNQLQETLNGQTKQKVKNQANKEQNSDSDNNVKQQELDASLLQQATFQDQTQIVVDINQIKDTINYQQQIDSQEQINQQMIDKNNASVVTAKSNKSNKSKSEKKKQKVESPSRIQTKQDQAKDRYKKVHKQMQREQSMKDNSLSKTETKEGLGDKLKAEASLNGSENDKIKQIDKFSYFEAFTEQKSQPSSLKILKSLKFFEYVLMITTSIVLAIQINKSLQSLISDMEGIIFRSYLMMPYASFTSAEFIMRHIKSFNTFPNKQNVLLQLNQTLADSYLRIFTNMTSSYQQNNLIADFSDDYINLINPYLINANTNNEQDITNQNKIDIISSNFTFVNSLGQLFYHLNSILGIDFAVAYSQNTYEYQSILFVEHNYKNFLENCQNYSQDQYQSTLNIKDNLNVAVIVVSSIMIVFTLIIYVVIIMNFGIFQKRMIQLFNILTTVKTSQVENEMARVSSIIESLKENDEIIEKFTFSIRQKEYVLTKFSNQEESQSYSQDSSKRKALHVKINQQKLQNIRFYVVSSFTMILFFFYILINLIYNVAIFSTFQPALQYLSNFAQLNQEVPSLLAYSSMIYEQKLGNELLFQNSEIQKIQNYFQESLQFVSDFSLQIYKIQQLSFFSSSFSNSFSQNLQSNLCHYYPQMQTDQCYQLFNGVLTQGLVNSLSLWKENFLKIQSINFYITNSQDFYINQLNLLSLSQVLNESTTYFMKNLYDQMKSNIQNQQNTNLLIAILFCIIVNIPKIYEFFIEFSIISNRFYIAKKIIFILPAYTLMIEETFNKMLKAIGNQLSIKK
ncbi:transmembrane protein, putative (macronuclear) [Tetrahymena thermophila SB210]|uniref:Transmembrane protein, putative n=1 Tax=Tetrahymena thermophila (strain SB210) TaxID=312017 RepID=I7M7Z0_TETTS|nr:transmembrane protein, putative [Tetrahymena thermophila SB210]EAR96293.2 transmembrane protein, putative [Tetrahymena thermophila SB210]|eukprot:XP_001016538.2 transmembrane protein, putative [Tetrahymena thermophila SB210]